MSDWYDPTIWPDWLRRLCSEDYRRMEKLRSNIAHTGDALWRRRWLRRINLLMVGKNPFWRPGENNQYQPWHRRYPVFRKTETEAIEDNRYRVTVHIGAETKTNTIQAFTPEQSERIQQMRRDTHE